ncbi:hypothetical protein DRO33_01935 [Candidatus Bathyarchaeota archaeon]|nr:MAG: hypothetical protein DRO33_01935 [Candidatus Bathyarchaeota archaeon]
MAVLSALANVILGIILGLASGFFLLEVNPSLLGGEAAASIVALIVSSLTAGLSSRGAIRGCVAGALTGYLLFPTRALVLVFLAVINVGFRALSWALLANTMTAITNINLVFFAVGGAVVGGLAGYLASKLAARREEYPVEYYTEQYYEEYGASYPYYPEQEAA